MSGKSKSSKEFEGRTSHFKLIVIGNSSVGKTSLITRFVDGEFSTKQRTTITATQFAKSIRLTGTTIRFEIWDTAGQERYNSMSQMYYRGSRAAVVVYDITDEKTFARAKAWVNELRSLVGQNIIIALVGNKTDLAYKRMIEYEEAKAYAEDTNAIFMETSAKQATNVDEIFLEIAKKLETAEPDAGNPGATRLSSDNQSQSKGCCHS
ncbi:ras-related protein Rab-5B-like [Glandiceps talaboti]